MKRKLITLMTAATVSAAALSGAAIASSDDDDKAEVQSFLAAPQDITAAINAAEAARNGKAVAAEFDHKNGASFYEVDIIAGGKQVSVQIDAGTGKVLKTEDEGEVSRADDGDIVDPAQLGAPLTQLVATAEKGGAGKVMSISAGHEKGRPGMIEVELANADGSTQEFAMTADGTMTKKTGKHDDDGEHGGEQDEDSDD